MEYDDIIKQFKLTLLHTYNGFNIAEYNFQTDISDKSLVKHKVFVHKNIWNHVVDNKFIIDCTHDFRDGFIDIRIDIREEDKFTMFENKYAHEENIVKHTLSDYENYEFLDSKELVITSSDEATSIEIIRDDYIIYIYKGFPKY